MEKLKFHFIMNASDDGKSSELCITSITTEDGTGYKVPKELQKAELHSSITSTPVYANMKKTLKKRHHKRNVWINVDEEIQKAYWDDSGNFIIGNQYPEEIDSDQHNNSNITEGSMADQLAKALEMIMQNQKSNERPPLRKLSEKLVLDKFDGKGNASEWLKIFEKECVRLEISKDEEKIEIMKMFLEKSCLNWYGTMLIKYSLQSDWDLWKENFQTTYANRGWQNSRYALSFKYQAGSLLDYALKKERLLMEARKTTDQGMLIDIIAAGLPDYIVDKINRDELLDTKDLFSDLGKLEHVVENKCRKKEKQTTDAKSKEEKKRPCSICKSIKNRTLFHPESDCWLNIDKSTKINNSVIETELKDTQSKNE